MAISYGSSLLAEEMKALNGGLVVETYAEVEEVGEVILEDYTRTHVEAKNPLQVVGMDLRFLEHKTRLVTELDGPNGHTLEEEEEEAEASACIFSLVLAVVDKCDNLVVEFQQLMILQEERVCIFASAEDKCNTLVLEPILLLAAAEEESKLDNLWALEALLTLLVVVWSGS